MIVWDDLGMKQAISIPKLAASLRTEADAYLLLEQLRWGGQPDACPHCGEVGRCFYLNPDNGVSRRTRTGSVSERRVWKCGGCRKQFSVLTGTIFHGTKIPLRTWLMVIFEMCSDKNGISAREVERKYEVTAKSAWFMTHRIREAMKLEPLAGLLAGTVVSDETWIGGKPGNRHGSGYGKGKKGVTDKTPVLSLVHRESGEVRSRVVPNVQGATLRMAIAEQVDMPNSDLHTDSAKSYIPLGQEFRSHETVDHFSGEYVRGPVSTNAAEGYFSQLKRSIDGTHHHVSREHLARYLAQFDFLATHHQASDTERMRILIGRTGGRRLTYKPLTGG